MDDELNALDTFFYNNFIDSIDDRTKKALSRYSSSTYSFINLMLIDNGSLSKYANEFMNRDISLIRKAFTISSSPVPLTVYHGSDSEWFNPRSKLFVNKSFLSTSLKSNIAMKFCDMEKSSGSILKINIPTGYPIIWLKPLAKYSDEFEVLLPEHNNFEVIDYKDSMEDAGKDYSLTEVRIKR